ncbi:MAG: dienelactone hydrolase family protein [bacterium]
MCDLTSCGAPQHLPEIRVSRDARRRFIKGLAKLPLAAVLAIPQLSRAAAARTETVSIARADGSLISAALALPDAARAPAILLIHEWWGLNDQIKSVAAQFADLGYVALAVDLYGQPATDDADSARALMQSVDADAATDSLAHWIAWLKHHDATNGKVATIGWCFGGGWSLRASVAAPVDASVIYYGDVALEAESLRALHGPVLGHFATRDARINAQMVGGFEQAMAQAGQGERLRVHWYEADHAFANPSSSRYDEPDAALSWSRTVEFLRANLFDG